MNKIFWKEGFEGKASGGYHFRVFDLVKFFKKLEDKGKEVVGLEFDEFIDKLAKDNGVTMY